MIFSLPEIETLLTLYNGRFGLEMIIDRGMIQQPKGKLPLMKILQKIFKK